MRLTIITKRGMKQVPMHKKHSIHRCHNDDGRVGATQTNRTTVIAVTSFTITYNRKDPCCIAYDIIRFMPIIRTHKMRKLSIGVVKKTPLICII